MRENRLSSLMSGEWKRSVSPPRHSSTLPAPPRFRAPPRGRWTRPWGTSWDMQVNAGGRLLLKPAVSDRCNSCSSATQSKTTAATQQCRPVQTVIKRARRGGGAGTTGGFYATRYLPVKSFETGPVPRVAEGFFFDSIYEDFAQRWISLLRNSAAPCPGNLLPSRVHSRERMANDLGDNGVRNRNATTRPLQRCVLPRQDRAWRTPKLIPDVRIIWVAQPTNAPL
jgi:hypothetical protein